MSKQQPLTLEMKHDEAQVRELRLVADVLNEQVGAITTLGKLLDRAAERIEWLSAWVDGHNQRSRAEAELKAQEPRAPGQSA